MIKINKDQFAMDTRLRGILWQYRRRHPFRFLKNRTEWYVYPVIKRVPDFPLHIDFETSSLCNLNCPMCYRPHRSDKNDGLMDFDVFKKGIDECAEHGLYSIRLSWRGEPTMHPHIIDMIRYAKSRDISEVSFITNGYNLNDELSEGLVRAGLDYFSVSIDGIGEKYEEIRYPARFDETVEKLKTVRHMRDNFGGGYPRIRINSIWSAVKDHKKEYFSIFNPIVDFITVNPDYDHSLDATGVDPRHVCQYLFQRLTVMWDGTVPLCICDKSKEVILGSIGEKTLAEIWHGEEMNLVRRKHVEGKITEVPPCIKCQRPVTRQIGNQRDVG